MKVSLLTTYPHGGAGAACRRLQTALQTAGINTTLLTANQVGSKWPFYAERLSFLPYEKDKSVRFSFSLANFGHDLSRHPIIRDADIIHLHWINQGFLSLKNIRQLADLGKPIVWTLHDMWAFTGGCHYSATCSNYKTSCGNCPFLRSPGPADLSNQVWKRKQKWLPKNIHIVTCSNWLAGLARQSSLLQHFSIQAIPNPIDTSIFCPVSVPEREQFRRDQGFRPGALVLLFVAMKVTDQRKGFDYFVKALQQLRESHPDQAVDLMVMGNTDPSALAALPYPVKALGLVTDIKKLVLAYGAADGFVIPSLEDNLPNTVMESLACGTPVIGFDTGGIPEMVAHLQEGFIAPQGNSRLLAEGVYWLSRKSSEEIAQLRNAARQKVLGCYTHEVVATQYRTLYFKSLGLFS